MELRQGDTGYWVSYDAKLETAGWFGIWRVLQKDPDEAGLEPTEEVLKDGHVGPFASKDEAAAQALAAAENWIHFGPAPLLDEPRQELWSGIRLAWPPGADPEAKRQAPGNLIAGYRLANGAHARWVSVRFSREVIAAMCAADPFRKAQIVAQATDVARARMTTYDPFSRDHDSFIIEIGEETLDR